MKDIKGVSEETTTGIKALNKMEKDNHFWCQQLMLMTL